MRPILLALACSLAGCQSAARAPELDVAVPDTFTTGSVKPASARYAVWWDQFQDAELKSLIDRGLSDNLEISKAVERMLIAQDTATISKADGMPQISAVGTALSTGSSTSALAPTVPDRSVGLNVSWLLDFNGKIAHQQAASEAAVRAASFDINDVRLAYLSDLITSFIDVCFYRRAISITESSIGHALETVSLVGDKRQLGTADELDVAQADTDLATLRASLPALERDRTNAENHIATLIGVPAGTLAISGKARTQPFLGNDLTIGIPADLIRNRPDIRAKEQLLYAAVERIGVAKADLYPSVTLSGTLDAALVGGSTGPLGAATWAFGSSIVQPIFDGGRRGLAVNIAEAESRVRYLDWRKNVLTAVEEVENLISSIRRGQRELASLRTSVAANEKTLDLSREALKGGTGIVLTVLDAQRSLNRARLATAQSGRQLARFQVALMLALGAGPRGPAAYAATPIAPAGDKAADSIVAVDE